jgi:hypothetical protein
MIARIVAIDCNMANESFVARSQYGSSGALTSACVWTTGWPGLVGTSDWFPTDAVVGGTADVAAVDVPAALDVDPLVATAGANETGVVAGMNTF